MSVVISLSPGLIAGKAPPPPADRSPSRRMPPGYFAQLDQRVGQAIATAARHLGLVLPPRMGASDVNLIAALHRARDVRQAVAPFWTPLGGNTANQRVYEATKALVRAANAYAMAAAERRRLEEWARADPGRPMPDLPSWGDRPPGLVALNAIRAHERKALSALEAARDAMFGLIAQLRGH